MRQMRQRDLFDLLETFSFDVDAFSKMYQTESLTTNDEDGVELHLVLPGASPKNISVETTDNNELVVSVDNTLNESPLAVKSFKKTYRLKPSHSVTDAVATNDNGILKIKIPKIKTKTISKKIPIN